MRRVQSMCERSVQLMLSKLSRKNLNVIKDKYVYNGGGA